MNKYEYPTIKVIKFASPDVITTSILEPKKDGYTNNNDEFDLGSFLDNM